MAGKHGRDAVILYGIITPKRVVDAGISGSGEGETSTPYWRRTVRRIAKPCRQTCDERYRQRLRYELGIISEMGFADYFLIVEDFMRYAKENHILTGPGRGSSAGSLVAYALGITDVDPINYGLII